MRKQGLLQMQGGEDELEKSQEKGKYLHHQLDKEVKCAECQAQ